MKAIPRTRSLLLAVFSALAGSLSLAAQSTYSVTNLGTLAGSSSAGNSINNLAWVTGTSTVDSSNSTIHAALWAYGFKLDLGTLGGPNSAVLWPNKNNYGVITGVSETAEVDTLGEQWSCSAFFPQPPTLHVCRGFVWRHGHMFELPTFGGINGYAAADNNLGQIVGWAENTIHDPTCAGTQVLQFEAALWDPDTRKIHKLPPLPGDPDGAATAINDHSQAVGISGLCFVAVGASSAEHMVVWNQGVPTEIKGLGGSYWNTPTAINNHGQVVGFSDLPGDGVEAPNFHAFFWQPGLAKAVDLGTLGTDVYSEALGINNSGQIVGESCDINFNCRAFLWENGKMSDLNALVSPASSLYLVFANDINDHGQISGGASDVANNSSPAFLAIPNGDGDGAAVRSLNAPPRRLLPDTLRKAIAKRSGFDISQPK